MKTLAKRTRPKTPPRFIIIPKAHHDRPRPSMLARIPKKLPVILTETLKNARTFAARNAAHKALKRDPRLSRHFEYRKL